MERVLNSLPKNSKHWPRTIYKRSTNAYLVS
jgi:hypothetical protein